MDSKCIFCQIVAGQIPAFKIYEDQYVLAFLDRYPRTKGCVNIAVKRHVTYLYELEKQEFEMLVVAIAKTMSAIKAAYPECNGFNVLSNEGPGSGAQIQHLFFQLIPRYGNEKDKTSLEGYSQDNPDPFLKKVFDRLSAVMSISKNVATQILEVEKEHNVVNSNINSNNQNTQRPQISEPKQQQTHSEHYTTQKITKNNPPDEAKISALEEEIRSLEAKIKNTENKSSWE